MRIPYEADYFPESGNIFVLLGRFVLVNVRNSGRGLLMIFESFMFFFVFYKRWR